MLGYLRERLEASAEPLVKLGTGAVLCYLRERLEASAERLL